MYFFLENLSYYGPEHHLSVIGRLVTFECFDQF
jgi:hypothetical protein